MDLCRITPCTLSSLSLSLSLSLCHCLSVSLSLSVSQEDLDLILNSSLFSLSQDSKGFIALEKQISMARSTKGRCDPSLPFPSLLSCDLSLSVPPSSLSCPLTICLSLLYPSVSLVLMLTSLSRFSTLYRLFSTEVYL